MHMAFLSRVFKNLQWYGMTKGKSLQDLPFFQFRSSFIARNGASSVILSSYW